MGRVEQGFVRWEEDLGGRWKLWRAVQGGGVALTQVLTRALWWSAAGKTAFKPLGLELGNRGAGHCTGPGK